MPELDQNSAAKGEPLASDAPRVFGECRDGWFSEEIRDETRFSIRVHEKLHEETSEYQKITVYDTPAFGKVLTIDDLVMLTDRDEFVYHEMLTHLPLLSLPDPKSVLIIGGGDCGCIREALKHPVEHVIQCEIDERVTRVSEQTFDWVAPTIADPRVELVFDDGCRYLESRPGSFDLVIVDSTDPVGPAVGLFRAPFYKQVARSLKPGGVLVAQTDTPHWSQDGVRRTYSELRSVFAHVDPYLGAIPTYPSGLWSWCYASNDHGPHEYFDAARAAEIGKTARYYHPDLQRGAFAVPAFARELFGLDASNY